MNPLLKRLGALRRKVRFLDGWQGVCALLVLVLGIGVTTGILDYWLHLPSLVRALLLVSLLVGSGVVGYRYLYRPFTRTCDDLSLALRIEKVYPELNDALASTVQFLQQSPAELQRVGGSESMRARTIQETLERADQCDFSRILQRKAAMWFGVGAFATLVAAGAVILMNWQYAGIAFLRLVEPYGQHTWTQMTVYRLKNNKYETIRPYEKDRLATDKTYKIKVKLDGQIPKQARIEIDGNIRTDVVAQADRGEFEIKLFEATQPYKKYKFRVVANDGMFPPRAGSWHEVEALPKPSLVALNNKPSPQIELYPPDYTDLPSPTRLEPGTRHLQLYAGTRVVYRARADRPLRAASIEYRPENATVIDIARLMPFGQIHALQAVAQFTVAQTIWGPIPAEFERDRSVFQIVFTPSISGGYVLNLTDEDELENQTAADLRLMIDPVPDVKLIRPGSSVTALPDADIAFRFRVTDEIFAVRSVYVEYRRKAPDGAWIGPKQRNVLYDAQDYGKLLPYLFAKMGRSLLTGGDLRLRYKELDFDMVWSLRNQFKEGELIVVEICADDFCDIFGAREPGRSHAIELRIVSRTQLIGRAEEDLHKLQQELHRLENLQKNALDTVKETRKLDKIDQAARDKLIEAEQTQREVQNIIGKNPEEGLRQSLRELGQVLKDNKATDTQAYKKIGEVKGALEGMATQELPQIEPKLADVRNELSQSDKNSPKTQKKLEETARLQDNVHKGLKELNEKMAPWRSMLEQKSKIRDLIAKEEELQKQLDNLNESKRETEKDNPENKQADANTFKEDFNRVAREQQELAQQLNKLLKEMQAAKEQREQNGDKDNAKKIAEAIEKLAPKQKSNPKDKVEPKEKPMPKDRLDPKQKPDNTPTTSKMRDVANELKDKNEASQKALDQQKEILKDLDKALGALEGRNEDVTKQDIQEHKQVEQKLEDHARELKRLQEENQKADKIQDKEERLKKKQELAQKNAELQEKMEKTARELARLQEQRAANEVNDAAKNLEKAGEKLKQGEDPQEEQKNAQENLKQAKDEVKQAEQELSRELLIKIADKLKALKERQDAVLQRSIDFQPKVLAIKSWTNALLETIEGNIDAQKGIADETDSLREKIKEAKVFSSILEKAKDSMEKAAEVMKNRRTEGADRRYLDKGEGEVMDARELKEENEWHADTVKHQKQAAARLERLLDALKQELAKLDDNNMQEKKNPDEPPEKDKKDPAPQGGMQAQDGIPGQAQLKALRAEQLDLNERTEDFAKRHPNANNLNEDQRRELVELEQEQQRLQELFQELVAPAQQQKEGDQ